MHLILLRHGETDWNNEGRMQGRTDTPLNAQGIEQAERLAQRLVDEESIDVIYTSPLLRAHTTANIIGRKLERTPIPDPRLAERGAGVFEGLTAAEFAERYPDLHRAWRDDSHRPNLPGAETREAFHARVSSFLEFARAQHDPQRVAIVSHGGTLSMLMATLLGLDIYHRVPFRFDNTSLSRVLWRDGTIRVEVLNDTCHLHGTAAQSATEQQVLTEAEARA